jgi:glutathione peroxidase
MHFKEEQMTIKKIFASLLMGAASVVSAQADSADSAEPVATNAYGFEFESLSGKNKISLDEFKGKVILVVNTASKCGFTPQYEALEKLYKTYKDRGLVVIGVPSNDFGKQEPGSNQEIEHFCRVNYGVTFLMAGKTDVIGQDAHPFFVWAHQVLGVGSAPKWNFYKYIVNRQGKLVEYYSSVTKPDSDRFIKAIETALDEK